MFFTHDEFEERLGRCQAMMADKALDFIVVFEPEAVTYHTGFYTDGYNTSFQAAIVPVQGEPLTLLRKAEQYYFAETAAWPESALIWYDGETPAQVVLRGLDAIGAEGMVGVEGGSWRAPYSLITEVIESRKDLRFVDLKKNLFSLRAVKSPAEIQYHREAAQAVDAMHAASVEAIRPGLSESELAIVAASAALRAGSDVIDPGPLACGERAKHIHAYFGDGVIAQNDLVFLEMDASKKRYRSRSMRTVTVGVPDRRMVDTYRRLEEVQCEALATVRAGASCRVPDDIYRRGILETGWVEEYANKTFYSMGFMLMPNTHEPLEVTSNTDFVFEAGMVFHTYISSNGLNISEVIAVTDDGFEQLTKFDRSLVQK